MKHDKKTPDIGLIGLSHKTAPVELRERFAFDDNGLLRLFETICSKGNANGIDEIVFISTCNRIELFFASSDINSSIDAIINGLASSSEQERGGFEQYLYKKYSRDAVLHLLKVASSLDSMVVGENEIFFQVKKCYSQAVHMGKTGTILNKLFHQAFKTAKRVRTETEISRNPLSIAYIAIELARKIFEDLSLHTALLIGAGEMGELILKYMTKHGIGEITIANRSLQNAQRIAGETNKDAHIIPLDDVNEAAAGADIIIASSSSPDYLITVDSMKGILKTRAGRPLFIIDIAVPRNVDPAVSGLSNVFLYNVDDLKSIADENLKNRLAEVAIAEKLVESDADEYMEWYEGLSIVPAIVKIQDRFDEIRVSELQKYRRRRLKNLSGEDFKAVEDLTRQIMTKTLHNPISYLKRYRNAGKGHGEREAAKKTASIIEELFEE